MLSASFAACSIIPVYAAYTWLIWPVLVRAALRQLLGRKGWARPPGSRSRESIHRAEVVERRLRGPVRISPMRVAAEDRQKLSRALAHDAISRQRPAYLTSGPV